MSEIISSLHSENTICSKENTISSTENTISATVSSSSTENTISLTESQKMSTVCSSPSSIVSPLSVCSSPKSPTTTSTRSATAGSSEHSYLILAAKEAMGVRNSRKPILHQILEKAAASGATNDVFWIKNLMMSARGIYPRGFTFVDNTLKYNKKTKVSPNHIRIPDEPAEATYFYIEFVRKCENLNSDTDVAYAKHCQKTLVETETEELTWANATKSMKKSLVYRFVESETKLHDLNREGYNHLLHIIFYGMELKIFHKGNVVMKNDSIASITALIFDPETKTYRFSLPNSSKRTNPAIPNSPKLNAKTRSSKDNKPQSKRTNQMNVIERWKLVANKFDDSAIRNECFDEGT